MGPVMDLPRDCRLSVEENPCWPDVEFVDERLGDYNAPFLDNPGYDSFGVLVRDETRTIRAGLIGNCYGGWLFIKLLWVDRGLRRTGIGTGLIAKAERRALDFGCHSAWVDTFSFQGPEFYPRLGYRVFATLDYPPSHQRLFLKKRLRPVPEDR
jgi:GNAT superfamily N-acetyltransferase